MDHRLITKPTFFEEEVSILNELFDLGLPCLHLRKPEGSLLECSNLLQNIDSQHHHKIIIHQHPQLFHSFSLMGWHLKESERLKITPQTLQRLITDYQKQGLIVGTSVHQPESLNALPKQLNYTFTSPVFPSISKKDYFPTIDWVVNPASYPFKLIALGGIEANNLAEVHKKGFKELALLGAIWDRKDDAPQDNYKKVHKLLTFL